MVLPAQPSITLFQFFSPLSLKRAVCRWDSPFNAEVLNAVWSWGGFWGRGIELLLSITQSCLCCWEGGETACQPWWIGVLAPLLSQTTTDVSLAPSFVLLASFYIFPCQPSRSLWDVQRSATHRAHPTGCVGGQWAHVEPWMSTECICTPFPAPLLCLLQPCFQVKYLWELGNSSVSKKNPIGCTIAWKLFFDQAALSYHHKQCRNTNWVTGWLFFPLFHLIW